MRKKLLNYLVCPNTGISGFTLFAARLIRGGVEIYRAVDSEIRDDDDVIEGYVISNDRQYIYPIRYGVLSMVSDADVDLVEYQAHISEIDKNSSYEVSTLAAQNFERMKTRRKSEKSDTGDWNREEKSYYDADVDSGKKRKVMSDEIPVRYLPHIYLHRDKYILKPLKADIAGKTLVEIGCGNARTIIRLMAPEKFGYTFIGSDISFYRLVVAKIACPSAEFVQASAFNLPFKDSFADVGIAFGMLHHLPQPVEGVKDLNRILKEKAMLGLHEPVETKKIIDGRFPALVEKMGTYVHSERDGEINLPEFMQTLGALGYHQKRKVMLVSPFQSMVTAFLSKCAPSMLLSKPFYEVLITLDRLFIITVCRFAKVLHPRAVILLMERSG